MSEHKKEPCPPSPNVEIVNRFGLVPNFFRLTVDAPEVTADLWEFAKFGYLNNPLPSLFKERLFVYLSRFCDARYCITRHIGFLVGLGRPAGDRQCSPETVEQVLRLIQQPLPRGDTLEPHVALLEGCAIPFRRLPESEAPLEKAIFVCVAHVFIQSPQAGRCLDALRRTFEAGTLQYLFLFLAFVRTAHYWTKLHPELGLEEDIEKLLATHEKLARCIVNDPEASAFETTQVLLDELAPVRQERVVREEMERTNQALRETEARYRAVIDSGAEMLCRFRPDGTILFVNGAYARARGTTPEALIGRSFWEFVTAEDRPAVRAMLEGLTPEAPEVRIENRFQTAGGERWTLWTNRALAFDASGRLLEAQSAGIDISDRKRAEQALVERVRQQEALYRLADQLHGSQSVDDVCNAALQGICAALQCERASILLVDESGVLRFVAWQGLSEPYRKAVEGGSPRNADESNPTPLCISDIDTGGTEDPLNILLRNEGIGALAFIPLVSGGKLIGKFAIYFNARHVFTNEELQLSVTIARQLAFGIQRQRAEERLRESEEQFRSTFENMAIGMTHMGLDGRWLRVNQRFCDITGYSREELLTKTFHDITYPDDLDRSLAHVQSLLAAELPRYSLEKRYVRKDGSLVWVELTASLRRGADGQPLYSIGAIEDISARRAVQEALRETDRRKDEFIAMLGHEIRNPLHVISTCVQLLRMQGRTDPKSQQVRNAIEMEVGHLARLVDDLLDVSRIARGMIRLKQEPCDLGEIVRQVTEGRRAILERSGLSLSVDLPAEPVWIVGDHVRLVQVVGNLLDNANKFTDRGGRVSTQLVTQRTGEVAVLTVRDSGIGMAPETLEHVFEPFRQAGATLDRTRGGLGLGLALVKSLVDLHGGEVCAASDGIGRGAQFTIRVPLARAPSEIIAAVEPRAATSERRRVLIIEDNLAGAQILQMLLRVGGHAVEVAHDGSDGLQAAGRFKPDVVLCDIGLPGLDGYQVARLLRQDHELNGVCLVAVSGYGQDADRRRALEEGFDGYLTKPVDFKELEQFLKKRKGGGD